MSDFTTRITAEGVAVITWDVAARSMNVMSMTGFAAMESAFDAALADPGVKGIVITSAKRDFAGGMDLNVIAQMRAAGGENPAQSIFDGVMATHRLLRKIERAGMDPKTLQGAKPVAAALPGTALGIGLELPLACHRILVADRPDALIGLPEIKLGIFPGAGGTTRLIRKLGVLAAAPLLLEGKLLAPAAAEAAGIVDEIVPPDQLVARACAWVLAAAQADCVKPWDRKDYRMPGGTPYHPAGFQTFLGASAMVAGNTMGAYPAARALLSAAYEGALVPFDTALRIEARWFTHVLMDPSSTAMIRSLFLNKEALEKGARRPDLPDQKVTRLGVIGAGMMGAGIAHVAAAAGIAVVLIDATAQAAEKGKAHSASLLDKAITRGKATPSDKAAHLARIQATADYAALQGCDLVIEAVFEDPGVKAQVLPRADAAAPDAIIATNTSTLPISGLARAVGDPARFIGIHFFSPVDRMALVEIIKGKATGDAAVAKALDFVRQLRKTPIVVNDARFFYANRCIIPYVNEGIRMVGEGVAPALIEHAAQMAGMPVGPLQLVDETSIELGIRIAAAAKAAMGAAYPDDDVDRVTQAMAALGRIGRKAGKGFYDYDATGRRIGLWPGLVQAWPLSAEQPPLSAVQNRLLMIQALEAVRARDEGVLTDIREGDVGAILGWGFAPWSGGPFGWLDILGADRAVAMCDGLGADHGARFAPPQSLRDMAAARACFYPQPRPGKAA